MSNKVSIIACSKLIIMKYLFFFIIIFLLATVTHAQTTQLPPIRTMDYPRSPKVVPYIPMRTSGGSARQVKTIHALPIRKTDPGNTSGKSVSPVSGKIQAPLPSSISAKEAATLQNQNAVRKATSP
jgi:hypothetical protein